MDEKNDEDRTDVEHLDMLIHFQMKRNPKNEKKRDFCGAPFHEECFYVTGIGRMIGNEGRIG